MRNDQHLTRIDGGPGTGKSTTIIRKCGEEWQGKRVLVVTYTNAAADVLRMRAPWVTSGTVYSLLWPYVKKVLPKNWATKKGHKKTKSGYQIRKITNSRDMELHRYGKEAPSRQLKSPLFLTAEQLHCWDGNPATRPVNDLLGLEPKNEIQYLLPLAVFLQQGAPIPESHLFDIVVIDEAQDMSELEVTCALQMLKPGGEAYAYGDPGQAIFSESKGLQPGQLPYAWRRANAEESLQKGYRCGEGVSGPASSVLSTYYDLPADLFTADHGSKIDTWDLRTQNRPPTGMVLCYSRKDVTKVFTRWKLSDTPIVPGIANPNEQLVVCTGHAAKGAEADEVFVAPWSAMAMRELYKDDAAALKLLYVMMTRARFKLHLPGELAAVVRSKIRGKSMV